MFLHSFLLLAALPLLRAAPDESTQPAEQETATVAEPALPDETGRPIPGSPPPGEGPEADYAGFESLIKKCDGWPFPEESFSKQDDKSKVYLKVDKVGDGPFKDQNLTKMAGAFGIHVVGDSDVPNKKLIHVANMLAKVADADNDGKPDNEELFEELIQYKPILFVISSADRILKLMDAQNADEGFPMELKFCPFAFDFEEASKIVPGGSHGDATCEEEEENDGKNDRTLAFVLDHLMGRGFSKVLGEERKKDLNKIYKASLDAGTFEPENTGCPPESDECGKVMFASWGLSTILEFDQCWCQKAHALKFCDKESLEKGEPELVSLLSDVFPGVSKLDDKPYAPKDKSVVLK